MLNRRLGFSILVAVALAGCSDSGTEPAPPQNQISGSYAGVLAGNADGIVMNATFSLTINQSGGDLTGSYGLSGTLSDGVQVAEIQGTGSIDGSIATGNNPSVNMIVTPAFCPLGKAQFSGAYDTANKRLTISGPVEIFDSNCNVAITYNSTIILNR